MKRFVLLLAVVFAIASVGTAALAGAMAPEATSVTEVASQSLGLLTICDADQQAPAKAVTFKPCGKRVNGKVVACHPDPQLVVLAASVCLPPSSVVPAAIHAVPDGLQMLHGPYRPPRLI